MPDYMEQPKFIWFNMCTEVLHSHMGPPYFTPCEPVLPHPQRPHLEAIPKHQVSRNNPSLSYWHLNDFIAMTPTARFVSRFHLSHLFSCKFIISISFNSLFYFNLVLSTLICQGLRGCISSFKKECLKLQSSEPILSKRRIHLTG